MHLYMNKIFGCCLNLRYSNKCKNTTQLKHNLTLREIVERVRELSDTFRARTINAQDVVLSIAQDIDLEMILGCVTGYQIFAKTYPFE